MDSVTSEAHLISSPPAQVAPTSDLPIHQEKKRDLPVITTSYSTLTYCTSIPLVIIPIILLKWGCDAKDYQCTFTDFPYVSYVLGIFPNDKTYMFLMQFWTAVQFCVHRAYY